MKTESRTLKSAVRASAKEDSFELHGTALKYGALSQDLGGFRERFAPGAFTHALADKYTDVRFLFNHSQNHVLGRQSNGTLTLFDTPEGLNFRCQLDPNQQQHRDLHSSIKRGDISEMSFAFKPDDDGEDWDTAQEERGGWFKRRTVRSARIYDISCVTTPAYSGSTTVMARSSNIIVPRDKSFEQRFFEKYGREYVSDQQLRARLHKQGKEVQQMKLNAIHKFETDQQLRARLEEVGRRIRVEAIIAEMEEMVN